MLGLLAQLRSHYPFLPCVCVCVGGCDLLLVFMSRREFFESILIRSFQEPGGSHSIGGSGGKKPLEASRSWWGGKQRDGCFVRKLVFYECLRALSLLSFLFVFLLYLLCVYTHTCHCKCGNQRTACRSWFYHGGSRDLAQVFKLGSSCLYSVSHLVGLLRESDSGGGGGGSGEI